MKRLILTIKSKISGVSFIALIFLLVFIIILTSCFVYLNCKSNSETESYNKIISYISTFQKNYNQDSNQKDTDSLSKTETFSNGSSAILGGYKKLDELDHYTVEANGDLTATLGIDINIEFYMKTTKNGNMFEQLIYFYSTQLTIVNSGFYSVYENGIIKEKYTANIWKSNNKICSDIEGCGFANFNETEYKEQRGILPGDLFYEVNERTFGSANNFYSNKNIDGSIKYYYTNFNLKPNLCTTKYIKFIKDRLHGGSNFNFTKVLGSAILDGNGRFKELIFNDSYSFDFPLGPINTHIKATSNATLNFTY